MFPETKPENMETWRKTKLTNLRIKYYYVIHREDEQTNVTKHNFVIFSKQTPRFRSLCLLKQNYAINKQIDKYNNYRFESNI